MKATPELRNLGDNACRVNPENIVTEILRSKESLPMLSYVIVKIPSELLKEVRRIKTGRCDAI